MTAHDSQENKQSEEEKKYLQEVGTFFYESYELSEGDPAIQLLYFHIVHILKPEWKLDNVQKGHLALYLMSSIKSRIGGATSRGAHPEATNNHLHESVNNELGNLSDALQQKANEPLDLLLQKAASSWTQREYSLLKGPGRNQKNQGERVQSFYRDPYRSYINQYVFRTAHSNPIFKQIFEKIKPFIIKDGVFPSLTSLWESEHPGEHFQATQLDTASLLKQSRI